MTLIELIDEAGILVPQNLVSDPLLNYTHDDVLFWILVLLGGVAFMV